jgi:exosortase/archaeosortase family protein
LFKLERAHVFVLSLVVAFSAPAVIPRFGIDDPYFFIMGLVLFAWFSIKWGSVKRLPNRSTLLEILLGGLVVAAIYVYKIVINSPLGLLDMIAVFAGVTLTFYGFRAFKLFWVPTTYGIVLLLGYQLENILPTYTAALQDWMANVMASSMRILGIQAATSGYIVSMNSSSGPLSLSVEGDCTGVQGILAFGMLSTLAVLDIKAKFSKLLPLFAIGFLGAFLINIVRLFGVFLTFEYLGVVLGNEVHVYLGYLLFIAWVMVFWAMAFRYLLPKSPGPLPPAGQNLAGSIRPPPAPPA